VSHIDPHITGALWVGAGIWSFFKGFSKIIEKRNLESLPHSKIRSVALGPVEVQGLAVPLAVIKTPFSDLECVYYKVIIEKKVSNGRSTYWETIAKGDSGEQPFALDDGTGQIHVAPLNAEMNLKMKNEYIHTALRSTAPAAAAALQYASMVDGGLTTLLGFSKELRFQEWFIAHRELVFVTGVATSTAEDPAAVKHERVNQRLIALKHNPVQLMRYDTNHDGTVSIEEWDRAVADTEREVSAELFALPVAPAKPLVITGGGGKYFVICTEDEKQFLTSLGWQGFAMILTGPLLACVGVWLFKGV
jgi:hypothetical protein